MLSWFGGALWQAVIAILGAVAVFGSLALIGCIGLCVRTGYYHATKRRWWSALWRWAYSTVAGLILLLALVATQAVWWIWLIAIVLVAAGFVGIFIVPGDG